jgi:hypothetical protein
MALTNVFCKFIAQFTGGIAGERTVEVEWDLTGNTTEVTAEQSLTQGANNTIPSPVGVFTLVVIYPPTNNTQAYKLKGNNADVGVECLPSEPTGPIPVNGNLIINLAAGTDQTFRFAWM